MAQLPVIKTTRTVITPFTQSHITPAYIGWLNDPETVKYSQQRLRTHDEKSCFDFFRSFENAPHHFSAVCLQDGSHIGNISTSVDTHNKVADIAILIGEKSLWGQGFGEEIWCGVMACLFDLDFRLVTGGCMANNTGMIKVMEKAGMSAYYTRKNYFLYGSEKIDSVHYVAENKQWK